MSKTRGYLVTFSMGILFILLAMAGNGFAQGGCKQVCVKEGKKCAQYGQRCVDYKNQCVRSQNQCIQYSGGRCLQYQQVCTQYRQVCARYQQACVREQTYCLQHRIVCPQQTPYAGKQGRAYQQLQEIEGGKDSLFDGGPGSTLNRR